MMIIDYIIAFIPAVLPLVMVYLLIVGVPCFMKILKEDDPKN